MLLKGVTLTLLILTCALAQGPPGVPPPQHNVPHQQQQPPVAQQQQQHQQQQQQQQQFQQQQHNIQEGQAHPPGNKLRFQSEIHNADHIIEHLQSVINTKPKEQMTEEELEFHYFKMHDYDNNNKLDGVEIGKALTHFHDEDDHKEKHPEGDEHAATPPAPTAPSPPPPTATNPDSNPDPEGGSEPYKGHGESIKPRTDNTYTDEVIASLVDIVLKSYDKNDDGYVEYFEYKKFKEHEEKKPEAPGETKPPHKIFSDDEIANIVDNVIVDNDENGDGYVEYFEFKRKQDQQRQQYKTPEDDKTGKAKPKYDTPQVSDDDLDEMLEEIIGSEDLNDDGYVDFVEFKKALKERGGGLADEKPYSIDRF